MGWRLSVFIVYSCLVAFVIGMWFNQGHFNAELNKAMIKSHTSIMQQLLSMPNSTEASFQPVACPEIPPCPMCQYECPQPPDCSCPDPVTINQQHASHFEKVVSSVCEERPYDFDDLLWNCDDMCIEGVDRLKNSGYPGWRCVIGEYYPQGNKTAVGLHAWAQNGKMIVDFSSCRIITPQEYGWYSR